MSIDESYDHLVKVLMIGESGVGKTCLIQRFFKSEFSLHHLSTIAIDFKLKTINVDNSKIKLQIWDTAGQERFKGMTTSFFRGSDGIIISYSVADENSFKRINDWMNDIKIHAPNDVQVILVANKSDLKEERKITTDQGIELAKNYGIPYFESSAKTGQNVDKLFEVMASNILKKISTNDNNKSNYNNQNTFDKKNQNKKNCCQ